MSDRAIQHGQITNEMTLLLFRFVCQRSWTSYREIQLSENEMTLTLDGSSCLYVIGTVHLAQKYNLCRYRMKRGNNL